MSTFTGKPIPELVMPIVFGGAVTIVGIHAAITHGGMRPMMGVGILLTGVGIILVASNTPHGTGHKKPGPEVSAAGAAAAQADEISATDVQGDGE
jgi:hypothetical protein